MNVLVLHGPNLNLLGEREPEVYGKTTVAELNAQLEQEAATLGLALKIFQSNHEGALIDKIHEERTWMKALVINPGAFTHYSYALRDAISSVGARAYEVHLSDIHAREEFRRISVIKDVCVAQITGRGVGSYLEALQLIAKG
jgi:3-dehydroquinate dehydratase-2